MGCEFCEGTLSGLIVGVVYFTSFIVTMIMQLLSASAYFFLGKIRSFINTTKAAKPNKLLIG